MRGKVNDLCHGQVMNEFSSHPRGPYVYIITWALLVLVLWPNKDFGTYKVVLGSTPGLIALA